MSTKTTSAAERDIQTILTGHPYRAILRLAWPATLAMLLHTLFSITDAIWVGRLGAVPIAAVISATFIVWILLSLTSVLSTGVVAMVARHIGAGDRDTAREVAEESFRFALIYAFAITVTGLLLRRYLFALMDLAPDVARLGESYMQVYFSASVLVVFVEWAGSVFRASGNTRLPLVVTSTAVVLNIGLDPLLIFGWGPVPRLGATGAAVATMIAYLAASVIFVVLLRGSKLPFPLHLRLIGPIDWSRIRRLVTIGLPISISGISFSVIYLFVNRITAQFGTPAVAALGIGNRIESINYLVAYGCATAVATLVGQNLGARNPDRAAELTNKTVLLVSAFTGAMTVVFLTFPESIMRIFVDDPAVLEAGKDYVRILALSQILMGWEIVLEGAFSGSGDTIPPMAVSIVGSVLRIPLAWFLAVSLGWGVAGVWWAISISTLIKGTAVYIWFSLGHWKHRTVH
ncbi:MAG: MATE family efflux transporter [Candidatus Zixiibacteriota bacterium]